MRSVMHDSGELLAMAQQQPAQEACEDLQSSLGTPNVTSRKLIASLELASKLVCANRIFDYPSAQSGNKRQCMTVLLIISKY